MGIKVNNMLKDRKKGKQLTETGKFNDFVKRKKFKSHFAQIFIIHVF